MGKQQQSLLMKINKKNSCPFGGFFVSLGMEINNKVMMNQEEAAMKKAKALENFFKGGEVVFDNLETITYGYREGSYENIFRVVKLKCIKKSTLRKKVTVEFTCLSYDMNTESTHIKEGIQTRWLIDYLT
jgi:hypothetical protein